MVRSEAASLRSNDPLRAERRRELEGKRSVPRTRTISFVGRALIRCRVMSNAQSDARFLELFPDWLKSLGEDASILADMLKADVPEDTKRSLAGGLNYIFKSLDLIPDFASRVCAGRREERFYGCSDLPNFYRKPYGNGWALVGDAGVHKDPFLALGICDAFRDAEFLAHLRVIPCLDRIDADVSKAFEVGFVVEAVRTLGPRRGL